MNKGLARVREQLKWVNLTSGDKKGVGFSLFFARDSRPYLCLLPLSQKLQKYKP